MGGARGLGAPQLRHSVSLPKIESQYSQTTGFGPWPVGRLGLGRGGFVGTKPIYLIFPASFKCAMTSSTSNSGLRHPSRANSGLSGIS